MIWLAVIGACTAGQIPSMCAHHPLPRCSRLCELALPCRGKPPPSGRILRWQQEGWTKTDFSKSRVSWLEIVSGGPPKDGIPSIDNPIFKAVAGDKELTPRDPVIELAIGGDARAYPLRILIWHEIVNDTVAGVPVTVTYCPLCNSAIVFDRRVPPHVLDFGTTGKLRNSDLVMYDRQTESWWQQFTGEAIVGALTGTQLKLLPGAPGVVCRVQSASSSRSTARSHRSEEARLRSQPLRRLRSERRSVPLSW